MKTVILIHGLHMHPIHLLHMKKALAKNSELDIKLFGYKSIFFNEKVLDRYDYLINSIPKENDISIVGHSMGGLVSRLYLDKFKPQRNIKLITLGTPHNGSCVAKKIQNTIFRPLLGKSINAGLVNTIAQWDNAYPLISIAGTKKVGITKIFVPNNLSPNDGTVFVEETFVPNATQHIILEDIHHTELIFHKRAIEEVKKWI